MKPAHPIRRCSDDLLLFFRLHMDVVAGLLGVGAQPRLLLLLFLLLVLLIL